jgi:hypothetical protein
MKVIFTILLCFVSLFATEYNLKPVKVADYLWCVFGGLKPLGFVNNICWVNEGKNVTLF